MGARIHILLAIALLAACSRSGPSAPEGDEARRSDATADGDARIACATGARRDLEPVCTLDRTRDDQGPVLVLRAPDGGFRRLRVTDDGRGVVAADGSEPAIVSPIDRGWIDVIVGGDIYRLPATVRN